MVTARSGNSVWTSQGPDRSRRRDSNDCSSRIGAGVDAGEVYNVFAVNSTIPYCELAMHNATHQPNLSRRGCPPIVLLAIDETEVRFRIWLLVFRPLRVQVGQPTTRCTVSGFVCTYIHGPTSENDKNVTAVLQMSSDHELS
jgi:hypothetical protein